MLMPSAASTISTASSKRLSPRLANHWSLSGWMATALARKITTFAKPAQSSEMRPLPNACPAGPMAAATAAASSASTAAW